MGVTLSIVLAEILPRGWHPGIGDPTPSGWATTVAYFVAAIACGRAAVAERQFGKEREVLHPVFWQALFNRPALPARLMGDRRRALFWWTIAAVMVLLGLNKQLDLQSLLLVVSRQLARAQGWYEDRQVLQRALIAGVAIAGVGLLGLIAFLFRSMVLDRPLAPLGLVFLLVFVLVRASSFHHVDVPLNGQLLGARVHRLLEVGGIACILSSALLRCLEARRTRTA